MSGDLKQLMDLAKKQTVLEAELAAAELAVKTKKQAVLALSEKAIPDLMKALELTSVTLDDGRKLELEESYAVGISEDHKDAAFGWLADHGHADIIKDQLVLWIDSKSPVSVDAILMALSKLFTDKELDAILERKRSVHPSTLKAFVKEQIEEGVEIPFEPFGVFPVRRSKFKVVKKGKGKDALGEEVPAL